MKSTLTPTYKTIEVHNNDPRVGTFFCDRKNKAKPEVDTRDYFLPQRDHPDDWRWLMDLHNRLQVNNCPDAIYFQAINLVSQLKDNELL